MEDGRNSSRTVPFLELVPPSHGAHLVVCSHGMWGKPSHTGFIAEELEKAGCLVLNVRGNAGVGTYDGLQTCAARLVVELREFLARHGGGDADGVTAREPPVGSISFVGYSAGGLVNRAAVGLLHTQGFFGPCMTPRAFVTLATPHLGNDNVAGLRRALLALFGSGCVRGLANAIGGRTVEEMFLVDEASPGRAPLLERMAAPDSVYAAALALFERRVAYGNALCDRTVGFETACLRHRNPYVSGAGSGGSVPRDAAERGYCDVVSADSAATPWAEQEAELERVEQRLLKQLPVPWTLRRLGRKALKGLAFCVMAPLFVCWLPIAATVVLPGFRLWARLTFSSRPQPDGEPPVAVAAATSAAAAVEVRAALEATDSADCSDLLLKEGGGGDSSNCGSGGGARAELAATAEHVCSAALGARRGRILLHLLAIGWTRVHVTLPGPHTHGVIVNRRRMRLERPGVKVVAHVVRMCTEAAATPEASVLPAKL